MVTAGQPHNPTAAINGSQSATERPFYRSPPAGMGSPPPAMPGPYRPPGAPPPAVPGPYRPPGEPPPGPSISAPRAPLNVPCPQCPIYVNKIVELDAFILANEEDMEDLRKYIAVEHETNAQLQMTITGHAVHIGNRDYELNRIRAELVKLHALSEALDYQVNMSRNKEIYEENKN
eukprot:12333469-Heterocapsa_arctica.AAC.1